MVHFKYQCSHCQHVATQSYLLPHVIKHHLKQAITEKQLRDCTTGSPLGTVESPIKCIKKEENGTFANIYYTYGCLACHAFYVSEGKARTHLAGGCMEQHKAKATEWLTRFLSSDNVTDSTPSHVLREKDEQIVRLQEQYARLEQEMRTKEKALCIAQEELIETKRLQNQLNRVEDLEWELTIANMWRYKYERLRYVLLHGNIIQGHTRQKLVECLESSCVLPRHDEGEDNWRDDLQYDHIMPIVYQFPMEYQIEIDECDVDEPIVDDVPQTVKNKTSKQEEHSCLICGTSYPTEAQFKSCMRTCRTRLDS